MDTPIPKHVLVGLLAAIGWKLVVVLLWATLGMYKSSYYSFGPSDTLFLAFVNVAINTTPKYIALMVYIIAECALNVYSGDFVYPWINAVVMNPGVRLTHNKFRAYLVTNTYWTINCFNTIFFFALGFSQVDFALAIAVTSAVAGCYTSRVVIYDEGRPHTNECSGTRMPLVVGDDQL